VSLPTPGRDAGKKTSRRLATAHRAVPAAAQTFAELAPETARLDPGFPTSVRPVFDIAEGTGVPVLIPVLAIFGGLAIYKTVVYWRVQYITAAMIGKHVPPTARRVLEYGVGQGKNLYYYPKTVGMVVGIDPDAKEDLLAQVSIASSVPFVSKRQKLEENTGQGDSTVDAVVTTGAMGRVKDPEGLVIEAARILKPGGVLVFVEDLGTVNQKSNVLQALTKSDAAEKYFEPAQFDELWTTLPLAPAAIGVAVRKGNGDSTSARGSGTSAVTKKTKDDFETSTGLSGKRGKRRKARR
jgi:SAM-dependent methyltransferase